MNKSTIQTVLPTITLSKIEGAIQHYAWGGFRFLPELLDTSNSENLPYAELWMGAHPKAPSIVLQAPPTIRLDRLIAEDPDGMLGPAIAQKFNQKLPYLFKVLDVNQMLSIQVHPTKSEAKKGFERENQAGIPLSAKHRNYRDDNHKPEIMVALTEFWLLHGFQSVPNIRSILASIPEFDILIPVFSTGNIYLLYKYIMELPQTEVNDLLGPLMDRLVRQYEAGTLSKDDPAFWAARAAINSPLPEGDLDRGIFSIFFFNLVKVQPGQGIFQDAGIPHAYLEGVNIELMANSDNVLRGGLTPKHIDVPELLKHTQFNSIEPKILSGVPSSVFERVYPSPAPDFELSRIELKAGQVYGQSEEHSLELFIVTDGEVKVKSEEHILSLQKGEIGMASAHIPYQIHGESQSILYKASVPIP